MTASHLAASHASREARRVRTESRIEEMDFLVASGVSCEDAALRAGWPTISAASRALYRAGRQDLTVGLNRSKHRPGRRT